MLYGTKSLLMNLKSKKKMGKVIITARYDDKSQEGILSDAIKAALLNSPDLELHSISVIY